MTSSPDDRARAPSTSGSYGSSSAGYGGPATPPRSRPAAAVRPAVRRLRPSPAVLRSAAVYGQQGYGQQGYAQQARTGQPPYGQYGSRSRLRPAPPYGQRVRPAAVRQPQYGQYAGGSTPPTASSGCGAYGQAVGPGRPGGVITAAVLGFLLRCPRRPRDDRPVLRRRRVAGGIKSRPATSPGWARWPAPSAASSIIFAVLALAWTVVMIWGSVWALNGRSRVMLLVGGSIALAPHRVRLLRQPGSMNDASTNHGRRSCWSLVFFLGALAIVVLLSTASGGPVLRGPPRPPRVADPRPPG